MRDVLEAENPDGPLARLRSDLATAPVDVQIAIHSGPEPPEFLIRLDARLAALLASRPRRRFYSYIHSPGVVDVYTLEYGGESNAESLLCQLAEQAQRLVTLDCDPPGRSWPMCPLHMRHPVWPQLRAGTAAWECDVDRVTRILIGSLPGPHGDLAI